MIYSQILKYSVQTIEYIFVLFTKKYIYIRYIIKII